MPGLTRRRRGPIDSPVFVGFVIEAITGRKTPFAALKRTPDDVNLTRQLWAGAQRILTGDPNLAI